MRSRLASYFSVTGNIIPSSTSCNTLTVNYLCLLPKNVLEVRLSGAKDTNKLPIDHRCDTPAPPYSIAFDQRRVDCVDRFRR
jgi:hypothetical protein